ncbi:MAG: hypothetical protein U0401_10815 [Anaerolineae bacterium]
MQDQRNISRRQFLNSAVLATAAGAAATVAVAADAQAKIAVPPLPQVLTPAAMPRRQDATSLIDPIQERGKLSVSMTLQFEPQMYRDANGEPA